MADDNQTENTEQKQANSDEVGRMVNAAVSSHLKRSLGSAVADALAKLDLGAQIKEAISARDSEVETSRAKGPDKFEAQIKKLAEDLEAQKRATAGAEEARKKSENDRQLDLARGALKSQLSGKVKPELLEFAAEHFGSKFLSLDENGKPVFSVKKAPYTGAPEEDVMLPLDEGVAHFIASQMIQPFLPAPGGRPASGNQAQRAFVPTIEANGSQRELGPSEILAKLRESGLVSG